jgi:hypothetical protein
MKLLLLLAVCFLVAGCGPASPPTASSPPKPAEVRTDRENLRRGLGAMQSHLSDLDGRLRIGTAQTWGQEASAAQGHLGNIRTEIGALRAGSQNVARIESLLSDLEGRLRGASAENWSQNNSMAQRIVGDIRIELQNLNRGL